jgi:hypothetical protein
MQSMQLVERKGRGSCKGQSRARLLHVRSTWDRIARSVFVQQLLVFASYSTTTVLCTAQHVTLYFLSVSHFNLDPIVVVILIVIWSAYCDITDDTS